MPDSAIHSGRGLRKNFSVAFRRIVIREIWRISTGNELASERRMALKRFVYVLKTEESTPRYYVGVTSNVEQRLAWHNQGRCSHTAKPRPWRTHGVVEFSDEAHATRFEQYLKSGSGRAFAKRHFD